MNISIDDLLKSVSLYNPTGIDNIKLAYLYAAKLHDGQFRQSGEPYIIHPLNVAMILSEMQADTDTICAGLLHDTLEDTIFTKDEIKTLFNEDVATLVDGVTKISRLDFLSKEDENMANTRKIILGLTKDVRIIIIKLADRLHNMRTLEYKSPLKRKENSLETMEIFVPLSYYIGAYHMKSELEDLSLKYLKPDKYEEVKEKIAITKEASSVALDEMLHHIGDLLNDDYISHNMRVRTKNIYGVYKLLNEGYNMSDIHDLLALKIILSDLKDCYLTLGLVHSIYHPINNKFKDYICNPKTNMYQSLHTTVFGPNNTLVQTQIRTFDMDKIASFGLTAYWFLNKKEARFSMQEDLSKKFQFYKSLNEIDTMFTNNYDFVNQVKQELFSSNIYIYTSEGSIIELPSGSTPIDLAYRLSPDVGNTIYKAYVNDNLVPLSYNLQNKDIVKIVTNSLSGPEENWLDIAKTAYAKQKIKEYNMSKNV